MKRLNLGCGPDYRKGWVNVDIRKDIKADIVHNNFPAVEGFILKRLVS